MREIIANDITNGNLVKNLLFLVAYELIIAIISYNCLNKDSWKKCFIFNFILTCVISFIKLKGIALSKLLITSIIQTSIMFIVEQYIFKKDFDVRDYIYRTMFLNLFALFAGIASCLLWVNMSGTSDILKLFGLGIVFILGVNIVGYGLLSSGCGNGVLGLVQAVVYVIALFLIFKAQNINFEQIFETTTTTNNLLKMLGLCIVLGISAAITSKSVFDETEDMEMYLMISTLKTYAVDLTIFLGVCMLIMQQTSNWFLF